jgi:hypothetical protein
VHTGGGQAEVSLLVYDDALRGYKTLAADENLLYYVLTVWDAIVHEPGGGSYYEELPCNAPFVAFHVRASLGPSLRDGCDQRRFLRHGGTTLGVTVYEMRCDAKDGSRQLCTGV